MISDLFQNVLLREGGARKKFHDSGASRLMWHRSEDKGVVVVAACDSELAKRHDFSYIAKVVASVARVSEAHCPASVVFVIRVIGSSMPRAHAVPGASDSAGFVSSQTLEDNESVVVGDLA